VNTMTTMADELAQLISIRRAELAEAERELAAVHSTKSAVIISI